MAQDPIDDLNKRLQLTEQQARKVVNEFRGLVGPELRQAAGVFEALYKNGVGIDKALSDGSKAGEQLGQSIGYSFSQATGLYNQLKEITSELGASKTPLKAATASYSKITDLARQLSYDAEEVTDMNMRQLQALDQKLAIQIRSLEIAAQELLTSQGLNSSATKRVRKLELEMKYRGKSLDQALEELKVMDGLDDKQKEVLASYLDGFKSVKKLKEQSQERLQLETNINKNMGVTGALVKGTGALMERLGMRSGIFHDAMEDAASTMREMAKSAGKNVTFMNKLKIAAAGVSKLMDGFGPALLDPAVLVGNLVTKFLELNKLQTEFIQLTGQSYDTLAGVTTEVSTMADMMKIAAEYTKQTGLNAAGIFSPEQLGGISDAHQLLGLSSEEASNLGSLMKLSNSSAENFTDTVLDGVTAMNGSTNSAVANKVVLQDVLSASEDITASLGGSPEKLMAAAHAARRLGMDLAKVNQIADGLMNFEDSIGNELEAQLLTGKNINLSKAREMALNNDLEGVAKELAKNGASAAEYSKMNRIQQESMAKALGMSRSEMGKMVIAQAAQGDLTDEQREKILGVNSEQLKQMDIQTRIQKSIDKISEAFAPVLEAIVPIIESLLRAIQPILAIAGGIGKILAAFLKLAPVAFLLKTTLFAMAAVKFGGMIASIVGLTAKQLTYNAALAAGHTQSQILSGFAGTAARNSTQLTMLQSAALKIQLGIRKAWNFLVGVGTKILNLFTSSQARSNLLTSISNILTRITNKLEKTKAGRMLLSAAAYVKKNIAAAAAYVTEQAGNAVSVISIALGNTWLGQQAAKAVAWVRSTIGTTANTTAVSGNNIATAYQNFLTNTWLGRQAVKLGAWIAETVGIGANTVAKFTNTSATAAQAAANATLATSQTAVGATGATAGGGLAAAGAGLGAFGVAAAPAIPIILAIGAALLMASPAIYAIGTIITGLAKVIGDVLMKALEMIPPIIGAIADGFVTIFKAVSENIGSLLLMGPALAGIGLGLIPLSIGLGLLAGAGALLGSAAPLILMGSFAIAALGLALQVVSPAIDTVAAGFATMMGALSIDNIGALMLLGPALLLASVGMTAFSAAMLVGGLSSFFGGGVLDSIKELSTAGPGIIAAGEGLALVAANIGVISNSLQGLGSLVSPLYALGGGLMSIAAGLGMIAVTGLAAIPALMALSTFAIVVAPLATVIGSMFEGGGEGGGEDNSMAEISAKLDTLISVVSKGGDVFLDGNKVGDALVLDSYKSS